MAKRARPVVFQVRPINGGLNKEIPPQTIDKKQSPNMLNTRFRRGELQVRNGFKLKYTGLLEPALWIDTVYSSGFQNVVAFTENGFYYLDSSGVFQKMDVYTDTGAANSFPHIAMDAAADFFAVDVGAGAYDFSGANSGALFPSSGLEDIMVVANGTDDGIFIMAYTGETSPVEAEELAGTGAPTEARAVAIFNGQLFIGGNQDNPSAVQWSAVGRFDHWDTATYDDTGSLVLSDSPDWIQAMRKLGEYLIVFKERSTYIGSKTGLTDPPVRFDAAPGQGIGLAAPNSIGDLGEELIFLGWDDVYVFSLSTIQPVGTRIKNEIFYGELGILPKYIDKCVGVIAEEFDEYWLFVPTGKWPTNGDANLINLFNDPAMIDAASEWEVTNATHGTISIASGGKYHDSVLKALHDNGDNSYGSLIYSSDITVTAGNTYMFRIRMRLSVAEKVQINLNSYDATDTSTGNSFFQTADMPADEWVEFIVNWVIPANSTYVQFNISKPFAWADYTDTYLEVDFIELVDITNVDDEYLVEIDSDTENQYISGSISGTTANSPNFKIPAYIGPRNEPQRLYFIQQEIGDHFCDTVWVFNYSTNAWSVWRLPMTGFGYDALEAVATLASCVGTIAEQTWRFDEKLLTEFAPTNLIGGTDGHVYELSSLATLDFQDVEDDAIIAYWESKDYDLGKPMVDKTFSRLSIFHETSHAAVTIEVGLSTDSGLTWQDQDVTIESGRIQTLVDFFVTGPQARFRINAIGVQFFILGIEVKLIPRGEYNVY